MSDLLLGVPNNEICISFMATLLTTWKPHLAAYSIKNNAEGAAATMEVSEIPKNVFKFSNLTSVLHIYRAFRFQ